MILYYTQIASIILGEHEKIQKPVMSRVSVYNLYTLRKN